MIVVDVQAAFLNAKAPADLPERIAAFLDAHPTAERLATRYVNGPGSPCRTLMGWKGAATSAEVQLHPLIADRVTTVVDKSTYGTDLAHLIAPGSRVLVAGLDTDVCVQAIATGLFDAGVDVHVLEDLCGSSGGPAAHRAGLRVLRRIVGADRLVFADDL